MNKINIKDGIKFECQGSGNCCVSRGSYGFVYLSLTDLKRFSNFGYCMELMNSQKLFLFVSLF